MTFASHVVTTASLKCHISIKIFITIYFILFWHDINISVTVLSGDIYALLYEFCFLWFTNCALLSDDNRLIPGCLWLLAFVLNNTLILGFWCSTIPHLPGCFCPWTFFQNIGFNMVPSDPFMSHLATQLGYSAVELRFCNWLSLWLLVSWINHLPPACWSTFWKSFF